MRVLVFHAFSLTLLLMVGVGLTGLGAAELTELESKQEGLKREQKRLLTILVALGRQLPAGVNADIDAARTELKNLKDKEQQLIAGSALPGIISKKDAAANERNEAVNALLKDHQRWQQRLQRLGELEAGLAALEKKAERSEAEWLQWVDMYMEADRIRGARDRIHNNMRHAPGIEPLNKALWAVIIEEERPARKAVKELGALGKQLRTAGKKEHEVLATVTRSVPQAAWLAKKLDALEAELATVQTAINTEMAAVLGKSPQWHHTIDIERGPDRKGRKRKPAKVSLWLPPNTPVVRGIILCDQVVLGSSLSKNRRIRYTAAKNGLAVILQYDAIFGGDDAPKRMHDYLSRLAELAKRPELLHRPFVTIGHSTGGIFSRNVAYWKPERVMGIIHIKSGNMHQHLRPERQTLAGVPFVAVNGEFEEYGPEGGGKGGIRPQWGSQTQWVMIREQMLRRRKQDAANLMNLIVHAYGGHGGWNDQLNRYCARFIHKAAHARLPAADADAATPVDCVAVPVESGWLTDADLKAPRHPAAAVADYAGDKQDAFWHFDEELARRTLALHEPMWTPDPSRGFPVPENWPPKRKPKK